jgi:hypothetical protein
MSEKLKTISVRITESYSTWVVRESIELNIEDYPELMGMDEDEIRDYIKCNSGDMKSNDEYSDSLYDELIQKDVVRDKITDEDWDIHFD